MSTEPATRRSTGRKRRGRAFALSFAVVVALLAVVGVAGAAVTTAQGPRVTDVQIDPAAAVAASGSRVILTTTQSLQEVEPSQVTVTPATPFTVDTSGRSVGVRFLLPLHDDTEYTVRIDDVEGLGGGPAATLSETFHTPPIEVFLLTRGEQSDTIFRTDLTAEAAVPVFTHPHIEDFRATANHLVVSVRTDDDERGELIATDLNGAGQRTLPVPGDGVITNLQSADRGELIGYTFSDADLSAEGGRESALYTASLKDAAADDPPNPVAVAGVEARVAEWRFVPDTDSILLLGFDGALLLTDATGADPVSLGTAIAIDGIARGSSHAVIERADGLFVLDLGDATEAPLVEPISDLGFPRAVTPLPGEDAGTLRTFALVQENSAVLSTTVALVAEDGATTPVFEADPADAVLQTCVSPSGRYAAILVAPDIVDNRYDTYLLPLPRKLQTHIVALEDMPEAEREVVTMAGFDISWCQVPPG